MVKVTPKAVCVEVTSAASTHTQQGKGEQKGKGKKRRYMDVSDGPAEEKITGIQVYFLSSNQIWYPVHDTLI